MTEVQPNDLGVLQSRAGLPTEAGQLERFGTAIIAVYPQHGVLDARTFPVVT